MRNIFINLRELWEREIARDSRVGSYFNQADDLSVFSKEFASMYKRRKLSFFEAGDQSLSAYLFLILDVDEQSRANRLKFEHLRRNFIFSHGLLRLFLADYLEIKPEKVTYSYGPFGKPFLEDHRIYFNMSHSQDVALYGFSEEGEIGVDIEYIHPQLTLADLPVSALARGEQEELFKEPMQNQKRVFYKLWTKKEAYLKALGVGLSGANEDQNSMGCVFEHPFLSEDYVGSVALKHE